VTESIIVGFDDTEHSFRAVDCAIREAEARGARLRLVNAYQWIPPTTFGLPPGLAAEESMHVASSAVVNDAAAAVRERRPDLTVEATSVSGDAAGALADAGRDAAMIVVGGRGRGGFVGQLLGSVALRVLGLAQCPVMVVRGDPAPGTGRIMVGVDLDDPRGSTDILGFAFAEAAARKADVYVVHIWDDPASLYLASGSYLHEVFAAIAASHRQGLESLLEPWKTKYPDIAVSSQAFPGSPNRRLVDSTRLVDVLVIGASARTEGHAGMRVGALAHTVLHHAHCPVIVVPEH
jgi:nucleotide-binding universal stress UspA family protein